MKDAFLKIFWGFLIALIDVRFNQFDIIMDPIGYIFIAVGLNYFVATYIYAQRGQYAAWALVLLSLPEIFIDRNANNGFLMIDFWHYFFSAVNILSIVLAYYILKLMIKVAEDYQNDLLKNRTEFFFKVFITFSILIELLSTFIINFSTYFMWFIVPAILLFIMHIFFIVLIYQFTKIDNNNDEPHVDEVVNE